MTSSLPIRNAPAQSFTPVLPKILMSYMLLQINWTTLNFLDVCSYFEGYSKLQLRRVSVRGLQKFEYEGIFQVEN